MANIQIKDLITVTPTSADLIPLSQGGNTRSAKVEEIRDKELRIEVENARGTSATLDERLDLVTTDLSENTQKILDISNLGFDGYGRITAETDVNNITKNSIAIISNTMSNYPSSFIGNTQCLLQTIAYYNNIYTRQIAYSMHDSSVIATRTQTNGIWSAWVKLSISKSPTEIAITGLNNFAPTTGKAFYMKTQENIVKINCFLLASATTTVDTIIFNLPTGYRPNSPVRVVAWIGANLSDVKRQTLVTIGTDGNVTVTSDGVAYKDVVFNVDFLVV